MFRQIELFNILIYEMNLRHRELHNKDNLTREFDTGEIVVVKKQVKSIRKDIIAHKLVLKKKGPYKVLDKAAPS